MLRAVFDLCRRHSAVPFHVEGNLRADREHPRDRRSDKPQPLGQRVGKIVIVENIEIAHQQPRMRTVEINLDRIVSHRDHPEHVVSIHMHVVIVDLLNQFGRSNRTGVQIKSNKGERALMLPAVGTDEPALAKSHVGLERQPRGGARHGVRPCSAATDMG